MSQEIVLKSVSDLELLKLYADLLEELRDRELTRTSNNPTADYAENVAAEKLGLTRAGKEERGYDATDAKGHKYQIKGRRITRHNNSRQLGVIRDLEANLFDYLVAVIFDESFAVLEIWKVPFEFVQSNSRWSEHQNGHIFQAKSSLLSMGRKVERIV